MGPEQLVGGAAVAVTLAVGTLAGVLWKRSNGRMSTVDTMVLTADDIGAEPGERATLVQFSTAFCQPCRATRRVLGDVTAMVEGVVHVEIDAESRLDLVRRLDILRTPTVLVLDAEGRIVRRAGGLPRKADVIAALGHAIDGRPDDR
ncbi:thiol-disulfide isomerase/thioredoxin [Nocardiopsis mwathae]|uniref:Thiol-disulfide isomerase/thioredoxin n=2 Tax=Nocardiopsis mwathae TaxID=1472723 RepID=A0A7X0D728_9ACTN|nr:thiol-disulfide isomerase/thioredoxin [Nocardiopsis mwathae]